MTRAHWLIIAGIATSVATMLYSIPNWAAITPGFVAGLIMSVVTSVGALFTNKVGATDDATIARKD